MKAIVDPDTCTGCELCIETCPEAFQMQDEVAIAIGDAVPAGNEEAAREAAEDCPVEAITLEE